MQQIIVIVGPTASGKSALAVALAKQFNGEVISADSRQVYRGLDIGTGKITAREMRGVRHHLLDVASPRHIFTAVDFVRRARKSITEIAGRGHIPIVAGGTAFWIDALVRGMRLPAVAPQQRLRRILEKKSPEELFRTLKRLDPQRAASIERGNPRRLIRAIEIARALDTVPALETTPPYRALVIGIRPPDDVLERKIQRRAAAMMHSGLAAETKHLMRRVSAKRMREFGFEYAAAQAFLSGDSTRKEAVARLARETIKYARR